MFSYRLSTYDREHCFDSAIQLRLGAQTDADLAFIGQHFLQDVDMAELRDWADSEGFDILLEAA